MTAVMIPYNTSVTPLVLAEYGRNIQQMIDYCIGIPDREERNYCARSIAAIMANLFPELVDADGSDKLIWDHMNVISQFRLDVDFPCEVITEDTLHPAPKRVEYITGPIRHRVYGRHIEGMIDRVADMEPSPERDALISMIAHHMKKQMLTHNREGVDDARILRDLAEYSGGRIVLDPATYKLRNFQEADQPQQQQHHKKKKKKK